MIPEETITEIRDRIDILSVIGEYVRLKKRGANHLGLCPFHDEKTPSFNVHAVRGFFHCFGCQASGDVITFLMRIEGLSFPQAVRTLAERAGVAVETLVRDDDPAERRARATRERLSALMEAAVGYYGHCLSAHPAAAGAREELVKRGISMETAVRFQLGYAPPAWDALCKHLAAQGHSLDDAAQLGLLGRRQRGAGYYDRFRNRLQFPILDRDGRAVAFSGRLLRTPSGPAKSEERPEPKYINSPEGPLYRKGHVLFGLHQARVAIRRMGWAIVCEGNFDLVALHQAGLEHAVAPMGTALTVQQAALLSRYAERVTLLFDGDAAGAKAVEAAYPLLRKAGLGARVAELPEREDPDSYLRERGAASLQALIDGAKGIVEYMIDRRALASAGLGAAERASAVQRLGPVLAAVKNPVEIELYIERVVQKFGVTDVAAVRRQLRLGLSASKRQGMSSTSQFTVARQPERVKLPPLEVEALGVLIDQPALFVSEDAKKLEELLTSLEVRGIFRSAAELVQENGDLDVPALLSQGGADCAIPQLHERFAVSMYSDRAEAELMLRRIVERLWTERIGEERARLVHRITEARRNGDHALADHLTKQRDALGVSAFQLADGKR